MKRVSGLMDQILTFDNFLLAAKKATRGKKDKRAVANQTPFYRSNQRKEA